MARYYELCDRSLGELMDLAPSETTWIVVADHGFYTGAARPSVEPDDFVMGAPQWHRMVGVFLASGPHVKTGKIPHVHIDDLGRTLLWLHGAPASEEMRGKELTEMMRPEWVATHPSITIDSYGDLPRAWLNTGPAAPEAADSTAVLDSARMAELQALGYISDEPAAPAGAMPADAPQAKATEPYNRANIAHRNGDLHEAERLYLEALDLDPDFALAMFSLGAVYASLDQHEDSLRWMLRALETNSEHLPNRILLDFVIEADAAGRLDRALPALEMIRARWEQTSTYFTARGRAYELSGRLDDAEREYLKALDLDPGDAMATESVLELARNGRPVDVDSILERHFTAVEGDLKRLNDLAVICLQNRHLEMAERALEKVLASDPSNPGVASNMAVALQMQGKSEEAARVLERAVAARPDDASLRYNLGAVLAGLERSEEALVQFEAAARLGSGDARLYPARAKMLVRLGRIDEARRVLDEGARRYPSHPEIRELLTILQNSG
jgi:tetratricopeptide (TPR) repeat protein